MFDPKQLHRFSVLLSWTAEVMQWSLTMLVVLRTMKYKDNLLQVLQIKMVMPSPHLDPSLWQSLTNKSVETPKIEWIETVDTLFLQLNWGVLRCMIRPPNYSSCLEIPSTHFPRLLIMFFELKLGCTKRIKPACISGLIISAPWSCNSHDHLIACKKLLSTKTLGF